MWIFGDDFFFFFFKFSFFGPGDKFLSKTRLKLWGSLETSKMVRFGWNLAHLPLGWIPGDFPHFFQKIWLFGPVDEFLPRNNPKTLRQPGDLEKNGPILLKFCRPLRWIPGLFFSFFDYFIFWAWGQVFYNSWYNWASK